jgi:hypothetical protein
MKILASHWDDDVKITNVELNDKDLLDYLAFNTKNPDGGDIADWVKSSHKIEGEVVLFTEKESAIHFEKPKYSSLHAPKFENVLKELIEGGKKDATQQAAASSLSR